MADPTAPSSSGTTPSAPPSEGASRWQARYDGAQSTGRVRDADFTTLSGMTVEPAYGPADGAEAPERIGWPGEFPFTRGLYPTGYRGRDFTATFDSPGSVAAHQAAARASANGAATVAPAASSWGRGTEVRSE